MASPDQPPFGPESGIECGELMDVELHAINALSNEAMDLFAQWRGFKHIADAIPQTLSQQRADWKEKEREAWNELLRISDERELLRAEMQEMPQ